MINIFCLILIFQKLNLLYLVNYILYYYIIIFLKKIKYIYFYFLELLLQTWLKINYNIFDNRNFIKLAQQ